MATAVVTGAKGFLGRYVSRAAAAHGFRVIGIGRGAWTAAEASAWGIAAWHEHELSSEILAAHAGVPDVIFHCAGSGAAGLGFENPRRDFAQTVGATLEVLEFIRLSAPAAALVYPSSGAVYGRSPVIPTPEDAPLDPATPYSTHKLMAEELIRSYGRSFNVRAAIVRVFSLYGPELRKQLFWEACQKARRGESLFAGDGSETRDWVAADDVARLLVRAGEHAAPGVPTVNCASGREVTIKDALTWLFEGLDVPVAPAFSGVKRPGDPDRYAGDPARARAWGWEPATTVREGMSTYARWFLTQNQ